jgi:hypothetical protein
VHIYIFVCTEYMNSISAKYTHTHTYTHTLTHTTHTTHTHYVFLYKPTH